MLLTLSTTYRPATDLGFLLHKHPDRFQTFDLSFGRAHVFYPEAANDRCSACLLLDVDPVELVRGKGGWNSGLLEQYVNDRPYVASSLMSVAIARVFGSALAGRCNERSDLAASAIPLEAKIDVLPVRGGENLLERVFSPLGYEVDARRFPLDERFPEWGDSPFVSVSLRQTTTLSSLLEHLYVLIPVFDRHKHYYVGSAEVDKLMAKSRTWLADHPERDLIASRYLNRKPSLIRQAIARLAVDDADDGAIEDSNTEADVDDSDVLGPELHLHEQRLGAVMAALRSSDARSVLDLGCGEGKLLRLLMEDRQFTEIVGMDVSIRSLEFAHRRLRIDRLPDRQRERIRLIHGALTYRDQRLNGFDAAAVVEVIEHLDPPRLAAFERVVFQHARPRTVILTTPNREYNAVWEALPAGQMRHGDHRFEWTRAEFETWAAGIAQRFSYRVHFLSVGPQHADFGSPSQMGIFELAE